MDTPKVTAREYYEGHGYFVCRGLIPSELIDRLVERYRSDIVPTRYPFYLQNTNAYEPSNLTEYGYVRQSFLDIHDYAKYRKISGIQPVREQH